MTVNKDIIITYNGTYYYFLGMHCDNLQANKNESSLISGEVLVENKTSNSGN